MTKSINSYQVQRFKSRTSPCYARLCSVFLLLTEQIFDALYVHLLLGGRVYPGIPWRFPQ